MTYQNISIPKAYNQSLYLFNIKDDPTESHNLAQERQEVENLRKELLANISHDLRTPLSAMRTAVELIDLDPTTQRQASAIRTLEMAIDALLAMTQDLLDPDGLPSPRANTPETAADAISAVTDLFAADARTRGLRLDCEIAADLEGYGIADPLSLRSHQEWLMKIQILPGAMPSSS